MLRHPSTSQEELREKKCCQEKSSVCTRRSVRNLRRAQPWCVFVKYRGLPITPFNWYASRSGKINIILFSSKRISAAPLLTFYTIKQSFITAVVSHLQEMEHEFINYSYSEQPFYFFSSEAYLN